ncbi:MAG TPA: CoA ester lyase [Burkholderiales bacterium]|nr:CoA ester lyase [Burkholderiales bacterium]
MTSPPKRTVSLRRSWVFLSAADSILHAQAWACAADALIADLEDSTPPHLRDRARGMLKAFVQGCRAVRKVACVRINPLGGEGLTDLEAALDANAEVIFLPKTESPAQIAELAARIGEHARGDVEIVPNIETAAGLVRTYAIASSHPRVSACLMASEDMTTSLGAERGRDGVELHYARSRFLVECRAAGVVPIDCPYTFKDIDGLEAETRFARRLGYPAKSAVDIDHADIINSVLTPSVEEVAHARRIVEAFERAHAEGRRAEIDGNFLEVPIFLNAKRLIERHEAFSES